MLKYKKEEELKQLKREEEFAVRLKKIQDKMNAMADTVVRNENEKRLKEERRILELQMEKEKKDMLEERDRKSRILNQNVNVNKYLMDQMEQKKETKIKLKHEDKLLQERLLNDIKIKQELDDEKARTHKESLNYNREFILKQASEKKTRGL